MTCTRPPTRRGDASGRSLRVYEGQRIASGLVACWPFPGIGEPAGDTRDTTSCGGRASLTLVKRLLVGRPLATTEQEHQRITKKIALAVFSSDAISSTAYATEEILFVTVTFGTGAALTRGINTLIPIAIAVAVLLSIVVTS